MKAVPKVNISGLYLEDELVDDAFVGVVPFYASLETRDQTMKEKNRWLYRWYSSSTGLIPASF